MKIQTAEEWHTEFFFALTAAHASEREVAGAVADVEAFCADSGQSPLEAFGDPREYARQLGVGRRTSWRDALDYLIHVPTMLGIFVLFDGAHRLAVGEQSVLTWGYLAAAVLLCGATFGLLTLLFAGRGVLAWSTGAAGLAASIAASVLIVAPVVSFNPWIALAGGTALLLTPATINTVQALRAKPVTADIDPTAKRLTPWAIVGAHYGVVVVAYALAAVLYVALRFGGAE